jgi:hypothetical protein
MSHFLGQHWYTIGWVLWLVWFAVLEGLALYDPDPGDTLSEHVWYCAQQPVVWWTMAGFLCWLVIHFLGGGRFG